MAVRRMQIEIERRLAAAEAPAPGRRRWALWVPAFGLAALAAIATVWVRRDRETVTAAELGTLAEVRGVVTVGGRATSEASRLPEGAPIVLAVGAAAVVALDGAATLRVEGPARLAVAGAGRDGRVRLDDGKLHAEATHRQPGERFAVLTHDLRVEVRGTRFSVAAGGAGSRVEVTEGRVAVCSPAARTVLVSAGESATRPNWSPARRRARWAQG